MFVNLRGNWGKINVYYFLFINPRWGVWCSDDNEPQTDSLTGCLTVLLPHLGALSSSSSSWSLPPHLPPSSSSSLTTIKKCGQPACFIYGSHYWISQSVWEREVEESGPVFAPGRSHTSVKHRPAYREGGTTERRVRQELERAEGWQNLSHQKLHRVLFD